ncbi:MAG: sigma-54-dependent Fis family transcriptional regulator [Acidobacteria bacterium]|nr:sigma-54-dependent Fis family transcriptional regulator [Acidobacteriota bacterium]
MKTRARTAPPQSAGGQPPVQRPRERVLVVDDDPLAIELVRGVLADFDVEILAAPDRATALAIMQSQRPRLVLLDLILPGVTGMELLERLLEIDPGADVILVTAHYSTESAVEAIQKGAYDYLTKPLPIQRLREKVGRWLEEARTRQRAMELDTEMVDTYQFEGIIGRSPVILDVFSRIRRIAPHFATALVTGDTGTGKELVARALHRLSPVLNGPFVVCNCAAIVESLFESELFGHMRGAFTGANQDRAGMVEHASGGTLFLDEIGEIPLSVQSKLLRVIQNREMQRLGSPQVRRVDVRIVAATNRDLKAMIDKREFREDLYYRLAMVEIRLPRLAERKEDIPLLQRHFLKRFSESFNRPSLALSRRAQTLVSRYSWPGNVRELENVLSYCAMMSPHNVIDVQDFPDSVRNQLAIAETQAEEEDEELFSLEELQRKHIHKVLERLGGNRARAAAVLGIGRATLYRLLQKE